MIPNYHEIIDYRNIEILKEEINFLHKYLGYELSVDSLIEMIQIDDKTAWFLDNIESLLSEYNIEIKELTEFTLNNLDFTDVRSDELITIFRIIKTTIDSQMNNSLKKNFFDLFNNFKKEATNKIIISLVETIIVE